MDLQARMNRLFDPPAPTIRGGVEAAGEIPETMRSEEQIEAWVEVGEKGVRLIATVDGQIRLVVYQPGTRPECRLLETSIDMLLPAGA